MSDFIAPVAAWCAAIIEAIGIGTITLFALYALFNAVARMIKKEENESILQELRQLLGSLPRDRKKPRPLKSTLGGMIAQGPETCSNASNR